LRRAILAAALATALAAAGCGGGDDNGGSSGKITGDITVLTQRTDIVNTLFQEYKKKFEAKYLGTHVKFEAITDYEGKVRIRMNTEDYGDVLATSA
jgi:raffinose/stachyose/melibiose transport system substrate-binding protein